MKSVIAEFLAHSSAIIIVDSLETRLLSYDQKWMMRLYAYTRTMESLILYLVWSLLPILAAQEHQAFYRIIFD